MFDNEFDIHLLGLSFLKMLRGLGINLFLSRFLWCKYGLQMTLSSMRDSRALTGCVAACKRVVLLL